MLTKHRKNQKGQALPVGIALLMLLGLMSFVLFNTGQTVSDKSRLVNTADSAVYSGLLWQARAMNFQAYTNRAMVANQVAMAQAVSINSWSAYIKKTGNNLNDAFGWVPYVGAVTRIIDRVGEAIDMVLDPISRGMLAVVNAVNISLSIAQKAMFYSTFVATPDVVDSVVKSNEPEGQNFKWTTAYSLVNAGLNLNQWNEFTESSDEHRVLAENERFHMINASLDKFSKERNWKFFNFFIPITPLNWVRFEKAGTTKLHRKNGKYEWYAKDALSLREKRYTWRGRRYSDLPISGGSALANTDSSGDTIMGNEPLFFGGRHRTAQKRSDWYSDIFHEGRSMAFYDGIQAYRSLSKKMRDQEDPPTMNLRIQISMETDDIMDSDVITEAEMFKTGVTTPGEVLSSAATAELYFEKPCFDANCVEEYANGYSPYWDVRLTHTSGLSRLAAHITQPDVLTDTVERRDVSLSRLPGYSAPMATPITDYKEQAKGVKVVIAGMENHLRSMVVDSPAYQQYQARLQGIKDNVTFDLDNIVDEFVEENLSEDQIIQKIAEAAGHDLDVQEYTNIKSQVSAIYGDLNAIRNTTIEDVKNDILADANQVFDELTDEVKDELKEVLTKAVERILAGMVSSYLEQTTGIVIPSSVIEDVSADAANTIINEADAAIRNEGSNGIDDDYSDDINVDLSNECRIYEEVNNAEMEVADMQRKLEEANQQIATEFHEELKLVTDASIARTAEIDARIAITRADLAELRDPHNTMNEEDTEDAIRDKTEQLNRQLTARAEVPNDRVEELTDRLMVISDNATAPVFPDYRLERRFAREAVIETLGDINDFTIDENGEPVSSNLIFAEEENEMQSDTEQSLTQKPEGC